MLKLLSPWLSLSLLLAAAGCSADEDLSAYLASPGPWVLEEIDGQPFPARVEMTFARGGKVTGQAPCNRFFATQTAPYPWFELTGIGATRMACAEQEEETRFLDALAAMTLSETLGPVLILSNTDGRRMVFRLGPIPIMRKT